MRTYYNNKLKPYARKLRTEMTKEENHLWYDFLKNQSVPFYRQKIIGKVIVDFYCPSAKLIIELDGSQHHEDDNHIKDIERDKYLNNLGFTVMRFDNIDVLKNFNGVCQTIYNFIYK